MKKSKLKKIKDLWVAFMYGMKNTEDVTLKQTSASDNHGVTINQTINDSRVSKALLKGELTEEVKELVYRNYLVDKESKSFEYYTPTLAMKRDKLDSKFVSYWNDDNLKVITIQPNNVFENGIGSINANAEGVYKSYELLGNDVSFTIKLKRGEFTPRFYIEEYTKRIVVRKIDDNHDMIDFYVSKYPDVSDFKSKGFVREIEKIKNESLRSDIIDIKGISFVTDHAYKLNDMMEFEFNNISLQYINEFDGHYVISFKGYVLKNGVDLTKKYYNKTMADKYEMKVKKDIVLNPFSTNDVQIYKCAHCGKEIKYDAENIDYMPIFKPRDIFDEDTIKDKNIKATEYLDAQICEQTFGIVLCNNCLKKFLNKQ